jgi:hypothetical protein
VTFSDCDLAWQPEGTPMPDDQRHYGKWSREELRNAEVTASRFLEDNSGQIADTIQAKTKFLETLVQRLSMKKTSFDDRLEYLARISEIARLIQADADGFFELASNPVVARLLTTVPRKKSGRQ